jgi:hypothetical protein
MNRKTLPCIRREGPETKSIPQSNKDQFAMTRCPPTPSPSTTDLEIPPEHAIPAETFAVEKWRIRLKTLFGRLHLEREVYKRLRP